MHSELSTQFFNQVKLSQLRGQHTLLPAAQEQALDIACYTSNMIKDVRGRPCSCRETQRGQFMAYRARIHRLERGANCIRLNSTQLKHKHIVRASPSDDHQRLDTAVNNLLEAFKEGRDAVHQELMELVPDTCLDMYIEAAKKNESG